MIGKLAGNMRIFLLGDSFTDNLYRKEIKKIEEESDLMDLKTNDVLKYVLSFKKKNLPYPLYFDEYLRLLGHEVINFGESGCTIYDIFNQFALIKKYYYTQNDRIIINWTNPGRYEWFDENGVKEKTFTGGLPKSCDEDDLKFYLQCYNREKSFYTNKKLGTNLFQFMVYLVDLHSEYKPIVWSPFIHVSEKLAKEKWFFWEVTNKFYRNIIPEFNKLTIREESKDFFSDNHLGRYGNLYTALIFETVLLHNEDGFPAKNKLLILKIRERINNFKHNLVDLSDYIG